MIKGMMAEFQEKIDEIEDLLDSNLLSDKERRYIQFVLIKEQQRISALATGMSEDELMKNAISMMKDLFKK